MSKSIYKEALENYARYIFEFEAYVNAEHLYTLRLVEKALRQAQKQEKLLELYKRLNKVQTLLEKYEREVFDITKQIKEVENE